MIRIDFIFDADCPAANDARANLRAALLGAKLPSRWVEWERSSPATPESMSAFGSPTILINGRDAAGSEAAGAASCRVYQARPGRLAAVPSVQLIATALNISVGEAERPPHRPADPIRESLK
jgi:mercuric ion transport protein